MPTKHGVYTTQAATGVSTPSVADSGIPFVVGAAPVQSADNYSAAALGLPVLCTSFAEAKAALGYSDDFEHYDLCEVMYTHFQLFGCQPVILCNMPRRGRTAPRRRPTKSSCPMCRSSTTMSPRSCTRTS